MYISKKRHELLSPLYIYDSDDDRSSFLHFRKVNFRLLNIIKVDQAEHLERILFFFLLLQIRSNSLVFPEQNERSREEKRPIKQWWRKGKQLAQQLSIMVALAS